MAAEGSVIELAAALVESTRQRVREAYADTVGRPVVHVSTPALLLDLEVARTNMASVAARMQALDCDLRPHVKVHKSPDLTGLQVEAGAAGLSVATVWEAAVMASAGFDDIFVVNTITHPAHIRALVDVAGHRRTLVAVDDVRNAETLAAAARHAETELHVLIEVNTGMGRAGIDDSSDIVDLGRRVRGLPGVSLVGVTGYEGHCALIPHREQRRQEHRRAMTRLTETAQRLAEAGMPVAICSAGGTVTWDWTAAWPGVTEIQAGSYVLMDNFHGQMVPGFDPALTVAATVVSRRPDRFVVNAGSKSVADPELITLKGYEEARNIRFDEEHGIFAAAGTRPRLGDFVELLPGYAPSTVNLFDAFHVVEGGVVVDVWPVVPRGPGDHGLATTGSDNPR